MNSPLGGIYNVKQGIRTKRLSSYRREGNANFILIPAGETVEFARIGGAYVVKHIWITLNMEDAFTMEPHKVFPPLPDRDQRKNMSPIDSRTCIVGVTHGGSPTELPLLYGELKTNKE